jgi:ATP-dependent DNA helicase RecG
LTDDEVLELIEALRQASTDTLDVEAKASTKGLPKSMRETLSSFSNTHGGGVILLGVDEESGFQIVGVDDPKKVQADLASLCSKDMVPPVRPIIRVHALAEKSVIVAEVPEMDPAQKPCYYKGKGQAAGSYTRTGDGDIPLTQYEVAMMIASRGRPREDHAPVLEAGVDELDPGLVESLVERMRRNNPRIYGTMGSEELLRYIRATVEVNGQAVPTLGGLLALGVHPQRHFPNLNVTLVHYPTPERGQLDAHGQRFIDERKFEGPIARIVPEVLQALRVNMTKGAFGGGTFDHWTYPEDALREVIVNALVHRDLSPLSHGSAVQIEMFPDRLEILNPGGLFGSISPEDLGNYGVSSTRNEVLVAILEDTPAEDTGSPVVQNRGTGVARMLADLRAARMRPPTFIDRISKFVVSIPSHGLFDQATLNWLAESFDGLALNDNQRTGLALLHAGDLLNNESYRRATGLDSQDARRDLSDLVKRGILRADGARRWTTYRLEAAYEPAAEHDAPAGEEIAHGPRTQPLRDTLELFQVGGAPRRRAEVEQALGISSSTAIYRLGQLVKQGFLERDGPARAPTASYRRVR